MSDSNNKNIVFETSDTKGDAVYIPLKSRSGSMGPTVIDVSQLYADTGYFTYDPGFTSTSSCESKITFIDG